ncbi:sodium/proton antiporter, CPA1 family [Salinimicrobium catena]|uniref:Sodium/proton antiporter, CPA1 family n=1 Tax=Salinimicrobium catena TaxID=390640 RepID=A0A1H5JPM2_9FLAO|nr:cation:proton antiporter [Salinimicrobium catena]SDK89140.1 NhaP-type Na+/H+ or K+/H+ antiporter [Salinimicrobium catena]SEE54426.1 sodium/proton antiporter, CPA1 family [Salinimicrobium catena]
MKDHYLILAGLGLATLIMAWLPSLSQKIKVSSPIILLLVGFLLFSVDIPLLWPDPLWNDQWLMYFSEIIVIISLMGAGLKIGAHYSWSSWKKPLLLVFLTMPICMVSAYLLGQYFLVLSVPSSLLLAAVLAPTDPVLAAEVQLKDPLEQEEDENNIRFSLTAEAGLNDGIAYPFSYLAVLVAQAGSWAAFNFTDWLWDKFFLKIFLGIVIGFVIGRLIGFLLDRLYKYTGVETFVGFLALSLTITTYGISELLHGYGFLAVFFAGFSLRYYEKVSGDYKKKLHDFVHEVEHLLLVVWIILFGGSIMNGMLTLTDWRGITFAFIFVLLIRPLAGLIALAGVKESKRSKFAISFFGIRGIGSVFYLSWAMVQFDGFEYKNELYSITAYIILISIVLHGLTAPSAMDYFRRKGDLSKKPE